MRKYYTIELSTQIVDIRELEGEAIVRAGRYHIAKTLLENNIATVDPLSPDNMLIFSAGPFAGSSFSNANRISVGCKSPLTGGIKEANGGGTVAYTMGQLEICGLEFHGASEEWVIVHFKKDGTVSFDDATDFMGYGTFETADKLREKYGKKISLAICGPVGEYQGLLSGISMTDTDGRPSRLAARGGVGAVMGSKKIKAMVLDMVKMPPFHDRKKVLDGIKFYAKELQASPSVQAYTKIGTMTMGDYTNYIGALPVNNFTSGTVEGSEDEFTMGGDYITALNNSRGGNHSHACMPGCVIQCSNVYVNAEGEEIASPIEYETLGLLGTNCGITNPDDLAALNWIANDLGIDTIETGAMIAVLMDAGLAEFGDVEFMGSVLGEIRAGTENGRTWAQGTARVGDHYGVHRVPVIKKQAISAYDPRLIEITGVSMMTTAQGADHTAGNVPRAKSFDMDVEEIKRQSLKAQISNAIPDSLGLCIFGRSVTDANIEFIVDTINAAHGTNLKPAFFQQLGIDTLIFEEKFNEQAGFGLEDDRLPAFFYDEPLKPKNRVARFHAEEVQDIFEPLQTMKAEIDDELQEGGY